MALLRHLPLAHRRWLLFLAVLALVARALIPAGWMPVASAQGVTLALCAGGGGPMVMAVSTKPGGMPMEHHHGAPDHPCSFAVAAAAFTTPDVTAPVVPPPAYYRPSPVRASVAVGRGLAAPPPPPTGPPAFA